MKYFIFSLGCKVNSYECSATATTLENNGYFFDKENPDVVIINTCSVTHVADQKSRQHIRKFRLLYPNAILVIMGCFAQSHYEYILKELDYDILLGTCNRKHILEYINRFKENGSKIFAVDNNPRKFLCYEELGATACSENVRAYLKVQDGCDNFCSYCLVPYIRGKSRSRDFDQVLNEAKDLIVKGYKEIVISGINAGCYGKDIGSNIYELVKALADIPGLYRLRISSIELSEISDELIQLMAKNPRIAKHFHIPLQSGSNKILKQMGRKYTREQFISRVNEIKQIIPDVALTSDVIVGFPDESDDDYMDTVNLLKELQFYQIHAFPYSPREKTKAVDMTNQINPAIKKMRVNGLIVLDKLLRANFEKRFYGQEMDVLVEKHIPGYDIGHTSNYLMVRVPSLNSGVGQVKKTKIDSNNIEEF